MIISNSPQKFCVNIQSPVTYRVFNIKDLYAQPQCSRQDFFCGVSQIRKFGITKIYACRALANPEAIAIYRLTRYRYFAHVLSAYAFRNLRYFI